MTKKIDRRRKYIGVVDVETAGGFGNPQVYDIGFAITNKQGDIFETKSLIIKEVFENQELMEGAYYYNKMPLYKEKLKNGTAKLISFKNAREEILALMREYRVSQISAYNLLFDMNALTNTSKSLEVSKKFLTSEFKNIELVDIWTFACNNLYTNKKFQKMAMQNGWYSEAGNLRTSAEIGYRYITNQKDFIEEHTGLADVLIEVEILAKCYSQNKKKIEGIIPHPWRIPNTKELKAIREVFKQDLGIIS